MVSFKKLTNKKHRIKKAVIPVNGVYCSSCAAKIESGVSKMGGVESVSVYFPGGTAVIKYDEDAVSSAKISERIKELGYEPAGVMENYVSAEKVSDTIAENRKWLFFRKFVLAAGISAVSFYGSFSGFSDYTLFLMTAFVWLYCGWHFHKGLYYALKNRSADMNFLVSLSSTSVLVYSVLVSFFPFYFAGHRYPPHWHEVSMLIAFINLGKYLEAFTGNRASEAASALLQAVPKFAVKVIGGEYSDVKIEEIAVGDRLLVRAGQQVPVDGEVAKGVSFFDESAITGEPLPVQKKEGDQIYAGILNKTFPIEMTAGKIGEDMLLMKIAALVKESRAVKTGIQRKVDKISSFFSPAVFLVALSAFFFWLFRESFPMALNIFASVLAVACPCAMGMSVPMAVTVGFARAYKLGFLINNPIAMENFEKIDVIIFDKTGTLTHGSLYPVFLKHDPLSEKEFLRLLLTAEIESEHPIGEAVRAYCFSKDIKPYEREHSESFPGKGFIAVSGEKEILAGSAEFMAEKRIKIPADFLRETEKNSGTTVYLAVSGKMAGCAVFGDKLRENVKEVISGFKRLGIKPVIASGDKNERVKQIADALGVKEYYAEVLPQAKHSIVLKYRALGNKVLMIGDGINDSAAVNEADIGVSMKNSSDLTSTSSDIVLMRDDISLLFGLLKLSSAIKKVIRQNLFWAFLYNIVLIPVAAGIFYPFNGFTLQPYMAGLAMGLSSVSVVLNSMRLFKVKI